MKMVGKWKKLMKWDLLLANIMLSMLILITFCGVIFRYLLNHPIEWMEEVQMMAIVWIVFLGAGAAFRENGHVAVELLVELLPEKMQKVLRVIIAFIIISVLAVLCVLSANYVGISYISERSSGILRIPYYQVYAIIPISCIWMIVSYLYREFRESKGEDDL